MVTNIHKPQLVEDFTISSNRMLRDKRLSFRARGILAMMLTLPPNWRTHAEWIEEMGTEGREAIRTALNELEALGYLKRTVKRDGIRFVGKEWVWRWEPSDGFPSGGNLTAEKPAAKKNREEEVKSKKEKKKGGFVPKHARFFKPRFPYPSDEEEMCAMLEIQGLEPNLDYDGSFYDTNSRRGWSMPDGSPIYDWVELYKARVLHVTGEEIQPYVPERF